MSRWIWEWIIVAGFLYLAQLLVSAYSVDPVPQSQPRGFFKIVRVGLIAGMAYSVMVFTIRLVREIWTSEWP